MRRGRCKGAGLIDAELQRPVPKVEFQRHAIVDAAPDDGLRPVGVDEVERRREIREVGFGGRQRHFGPNLQLVGRLPVGSEIEHPALGHARAGVARCPQVRIDHASGRTADADGARDGGLNGAEVNRAVRAVDRAEIDRFERGVVHCVDDRRRRGARYLDAVALLSAAFGC